MGGNDGELYWRMRRELLRREPDAFNVDPGALPPKDIMCNDLALVNRSAGWVRYLATIQHGQRRQVAGIIGAHIVPNTDPAYAMIGSFYVRKFVRGRGVGTTLLRTTLCYLEPKVDEVRLEVAVSNLRAIQLYSRLGFSATGDTCEWWDGSDLYEIEMSAEVMNVLHAIH